jgi:predicted esterase
LIGPQFFQAFPRDLLPWPSFAARVTSDLNLQVLCFHLKPQMSPGAPSVVPCTLVQAFEFLSSEQSAQVSLLCHGYGAQAYDLLPLVINHAPRKKDHLIFSFQAPLDMQGQWERGAPGQQACWFPLPWEWQLKMSRGDFSWCREASHFQWPPLALKGIELLVAFLALLPQSTNIHYQLLGFSQGGMLLPLALAESNLLSHIPNTQSSPITLIFASTMGLSLEDPLIKLQQQCQSRAVGSLQILCAHGRQDSVIPFAQGQALYQALKSLSSAKTVVEHQWFDGGHEISQNLVEYLRQKL